MQFAQSCEESGGGQRPQTRLPYSPPRLREYGSLRDLTRGGVGSKTENMSGAGNTMRRP